MDGNAKNMFTQDEYQLAQLGYRQELFRSLGLFENWRVESVPLFRTRADSVQGRLRLL